MMIYGTPQTRRSTSELERGQDPDAPRPASASPRRPTARAIPYLFPIAATYWSQGAAAVKFVKDKLGGSLKGKKIAYVYLRQSRPARSRCRSSRTCRRPKGFELRTFAVPPPGVEMGAQVLDITQRYRPDFVIDHLFGRSPSVAIKEFKRAGYPLSKVVGLVWASAEADIEAAGGWAVAEGYNTMQFAGAGDDYPVRQEIKAMYKKDGKEPPKEMDDTVIYNRGLLQRRAPCRGDPQRPEGERRQEADRRGRQEGLRADPRLHARRAGAAAGDHRRPTTKAAAGCRSSRSRAASSSRRRTGSAPIAMSSNMRSRRRNSSITGTKPKEQ